MKAVLPLAALVVLSPMSALAQTADVSEARQRADIAAMVGFGTRHTLSSETDPKRGIGAARRWVESEFRKTSASCGGCLDIALPETTVTGARMPQPTHIVNVVAIQRGTERPHEVVIVQGHLDSRVSDVMDAASDAPGANDDASGVALVLEAARVLSRRKFPTTIVYAALQGEEQGLFGGKLLADYAKSQGWIVKAVLNNDIVGGSQGSDRLVDNVHVRVFSEGPRANGDDKLRAAARRFGGENDSPSRNLSRFVAGLQQPGLAVRQVWRADRMGRGGDHLPFQDMGFPAIRFTVAIENYDWQHQDLRRANGVDYGDTIDHVDFAYLAKVTRLNIRTLAALARAPLPPIVEAEAAVSPYTTIKWGKVPGAISYRLYRRRTDQPGWEPKPRTIPNGPDSSLRLDGVRGDDWFFGMSSVAADGTEGPIASALPGGAYVP